MKKIGAFLLMWLALVGAAIATPAKVQSCSSNSYSFDGTNSVITCTFGSAIGSGHTVVGGYAISSGTAPPYTVVTFTDDKVDIYNSETQINDASSGEQVAFSLSNITTGPITLTLTVLGNVSLTILATEFSGTETTTSDGRDSTAHGGQFQTSPGTGANGTTSGPFTTATNGDLLVGITTNLNPNTTATVTAGTTTNASYTIDTTSPFTAFVNLKMTSELAVQSTAGASSAGTFTQTVNDGRLTSLIAIKASATGPSGGTKRSLTGVGN